MALTCKYKLVHTVEIIGNCVEMNTKKRMEIVSHASRLKQLGSVVMEEKDFEEWKWND
jgi:hypothetical protein